MYYSKPRLKGRWGRTFKVKRDTITIRKNKKSLTIIKKSGKGKNKKVYEYKIIKWVDSIIVNSCIIFSFHFPYAKLFS